MKVIGAYAIAAALNAQQIAAAGLLMGLLLLVLAATGAVTLIGRYAPHAVVRGVQFTTGILLLAHGVRFIFGTSAFQQAAGVAEPALTRQSLGPLPTGLVLGVAAVVTILLLLGNRTLPAALAAIGLGVACGLGLGAHRALADFHLGLHLPRLLPHGLPSLADLIVVIPVLVLPQLPMTVGNAIIAQADLTRQYFGEETARRQSFRALAVSMGLANLACPLVGAMPLCHGAGGLAAHYRFGARTAGAALMIGGLLLAMGVLVGDQGVALLSLLPLSVLGALLVFAGAELALMVRDIRESRDFMVVIVILGVGLATNLGLGFLVGLALAWLGQWRTRAASA
jgi:SulP family sulfate permease